MKRTRRLLPLLIIGAILLLAVILFVIMSIAGLTFATGRYLETDNGSAIIVSHNSPTVMLNRTGFDLFKNLETGDKILLIHGATAESYPARTGAYALFKLGRGSIHDIPQSVRDTLKELGWIAKKPYDDFSFSLTWNCFGVSSYDSESGRLIKTTDATHPEDYITEYHLSDAEKEYIYRLVSDLDLSSYPDKYDPHEGMASEPPMTLILTVRTGDLVKTVEAKNIAISYESRNPKGQAFLTACREIVDLLTATDEWKALPDYEFLYE